MTFTSSNDDGLDWAGHNFVNGPGLPGYSRKTKMRAKRAVMSSFTINFVRFDHLHQFSPFQLSTNVGNYDFVAKITTK